MKFLKYVWKQYKRDTRIRKAQAETDVMIKQMKTMTGKEMEAKWGNPSAVFARLQWKLHCAKNDIFQCKKCNKWYKDGYSCKCQEE
jgi:hypothetical protein